VSDQSVWKGAPAVGFKLGIATSNRTMIFMGAKSSLAYMDRIARAYDTYTDAMGDGGLKGVFATIASPVNTEPHSSAFSILLTINMLAY
jgi:hypothetical protein